MPKVCGGGLIFEQGFLSRVFCRVANILSWSNVQRCRRREAHSFLETVTHPIAHAHNQVAMNEPNSNHTLSNPGGGGQAEFPWNRTIIGLPYFPPSASPPSTPPQALDNEAAGELDNDTASLFVHAPRSPSPIEDEPALRERTIWVAGSLAPWELEHRQPEAYDSEPERWATSTPRRHGRTLSPLPYSARKRQRRFSTSSSASSTDDDAASVHAIAPGSPQGPSSPQSLRSTRSTCEVDAPPSDPHSQHRNAPWVAPNTGEEDQHDHHNKGGVACCGDPEDASNKVDKASTCNTLPQDTSIATSSVSHPSATDEDATYVDEGLDDDEAFDDELEDEDLLDAAYEDRYEEEDVLDQHTLEDTSSIRADEDELFDVVTSSPSTSAPLDEDATRFEACVIAFCRYLVEYCRSVGTLSDFSALGSEQPFCHSAFVLLIKSEPEVLARNVLSIIPSPVKSLLGRRNLSVNDLFALPVIPPLSKKIGCYLALSTKEVELDAPSSVYPTILIDGERNEAGVYAGSTSKSFGSRMDEHQKQADKRHSGIINRVTSSKQYVFRGRDDVRTSTFALACVPPSRKETAKSLSFLVEALMQAYLNLVSPTETITPWHRPATCRFISAMRAASGLEPPDLSQYRLNKAWSLSQGGFLIPKSTRKCHVCDKHAKLLRLATAGDMFGKRVCEEHYFEAQREDPVWLAGGPCCRCHRPRGNGK